MATGLSFITDRPGGEEHRAEEQRQLATVTDFKAAGQGAAARHPGVRRSKCGVDGLALRAAARFGAPAQLPASPARVLAHDVSAGAQLVRTAT